MRNLIVWFFKDPAPCRKVLKVVIRKLKLGSYQFRYAIGALDRPHYAFLVFQAAQLAYRLGEKRVSILEFGVAGGGGLLSLEYHAEQIEKIFPVKIEIYGFDTGAGLPALVDYRDLPYHWKPGFFRMDVPALEKRLKRAKLVLGNVRETVSEFISKYNPAIIGGVSQDLDFYSSTKDAFKLFDENPDRFLPRTICYFDDVIGTDIEFYGDFTGERLAIHEFNAEHQHSKLSPIYWLTSIVCAPSWHFQMYVLHLFEHPRYNQFVSDENQQLPI
jgi:hypothetical protein